jgi:hypothetical protein
MAKVSCCIELNSKRGADREKENKEKKELILPELPENGQNTRGQPAKQGAAGGRMRRIIPLTSHLTPMLWPSYRSLAYHSPMHPLPYAIMLNPLPGTGLVIPPSLHFLSVTRDVRPEPASISPHL